MRPPKFASVSLLSSRYLRRPPPPPREPMLDAPRELLPLARLAPEAPPEAPLNPLLPLRVEVCGTLRLPTLSPPPEGRLAAVLLAPARFALAVLALPARFALAVPAPADRVASCPLPRVLPPYLVAVLRFE